MNANRPDVERLLADADQWGPDGSLGNNADHAAAAPASEANAVDDALGLQLISIRLQKSLLRDLKAIASHYGIGYQPMVRDLLVRFARAETRSIIHEQLKEIDAAEAAAEREGKATPPVESFLRKLA